MITTYTCYFKDERCDGCGEHSFCEKWNKQAEKERLEEMEAQRKRMECGKCDKCKADGVKLNAVMGHIWDLCDGCFKQYNKGKKITKKN